MVSLGLTLGALRNAASAGGGGVVASVYALNFAAGTYSRPDATTIADPVAAGLLTVARASAGYAQKGDGTWQGFAANTLRRTDKGLLIERPVTNPINSGFADGANPGTLAVITPTVTGGVVSAVLASGGGFYTNSSNALLTGTVNLIFVGGGGSGAAGTATLTAGVVTAISITNGGTGYTSNPAIYVSANCGMLPRGFLFSMPAGLFWQIIDTGSVTDSNTGLPRMRVRVVGTATAGSAEWRFMLSGANAGAWPVAPTDYVMGSLYLGLASGTLPAGGVALLMTPMAGNGPSTLTADDAFYSGWNPLSSYSLALPAAPTTATRIESQPILCSGSDGATGTMRLGLNWTFAATTYDFVVDIVAPQIEKLPSYYNHATSPVIGRSVQTTGTGTIGTKPVTVASAASIAVGMTVVGSGVPAYTTVQAVSGTTVTLSNNLTTGISGATLTFYGGRREADAVAASGGLLTLAQSSAATIKAKIGARRWRASNAAAQVKGYYPVNPMALPMLGYNAGTKLLQREADGGVATALASGAATFRAWLGNWTLGAKESTITWGGGSVGLASEAGADYVTAAGAAPSIASLQIGTVDGTAYLDGYLTSLTVSDAYTADLSAVASITADIGIYGAKFAGITAAIRAKKEGKAPVIIGDWREYTLGGMTSNGLGSTDIVTNAAYGGLAKSLYVRASARRGTISDSVLVNEPRLFRATLEEMVCENAIPVYWTGGAVSAVKNGATKRVTQLSTRSRSNSGKVCAAKAFNCRRWAAPDYEGDLLPIFGISNQRGRQGNAAYNETRGGWDMTQSNTLTNQSLNGGNDKQPRLGLTSLITVDPWVTPGDPSSGLLPGLAENVRVVADLTGVTGDYAGQYAIQTSPALTRKVYRWTGSSWVLPNSGDPDLRSMQAYAFRLTMLRKRTVLETTPAGTTTATGTIGTNTITVASSSGFVASYTVTGTGIPAGTTVLSVAGTTITLSANLTQTLSGSQVVVYSPQLSNGSISRFLPIFANGASTDPASFGFTAAKVEGFIRLLAAMDAKAVSQGRSWATNATAIDTTGTLSVQANSGQATMVFQSVPTDGGGNNVIAGYRTLIGGTYYTVQSVSGATVTLTANLPSNIPSGTAVTFINASWGMNDLFAMKTGQDGNSLIVDVNFLTPFSNDYIGGAPDYIGPDASTNASPAARETVWQNHINYVYGLWWAMQYHSDSRITGSANLSAMRAEALTWGWDKWHYTDTLPGDPVGIPPQLYVREGRRMVNADLASYSGYVPVCLLLSATGTAGTNTLTFASTAGVSVGMSVYHNATTSRIPAGTTVTAVTATTVTLSNTITGGNIAAGSTGGGISFVGAGGVANANPVWSEQDILMPDGSTPRDPRSIGVISYPIDSHPYITVPMWTGTEWSLWSEGEVFITISQLISGRGYPHGADKMSALPVGALLPAASECTNFMSTFAVATSKVAFGGFRMEATSAVSGEAAGLWLAMADEADIDAQAVNYSAFRSRYLSTDTGARNAAGNPMPPVAPLVN